MPEVDAYWKDLALWLLDCEAATLERLKGLKTASKAEIRRHTEICSRSLSAIEAKAFFDQHNNRPINVVVERAKKAIQE